jgi:hypothetical protein
MKTAEYVLTRGNHLNERVIALSHSLDTQLAPQSKLVLSFDLYCVLLEYTVLVGQLNLADGQTVEELLSYDDLLFDTGLHKLIVSVDFFSPANSVQIC